MLIEEYSALTEKEETFGLYGNPSTIGFKKNWETLLKQKGLYYEGHTLHTSAEPESLEEDEDIEVHRHKTAITRYNFSKPVQSILEYNLLEETESFFQLNSYKNTRENLVQNFCESGKIDHHFITYFFSEMIFPSLYCY